MQWIGLGCGRLRRRSQCSRVSALETLLEPPEVLDPPRMISRGPVWPAWRGDREWRWHVERSGLGRARHSRPPAKHAFTPVGCDIDNADRAVRGLPHQDAPLRRDPPPARARELETPLVVLHHVILADDAGGLEAEDVRVAPAVVIPRAMLIDRARVQDGKARIVRGKIRGFDERIRGVEIVDPAQPEFLDQAVLMRAHGLVPRGPSPAGSSRR